MLNGTARSSSSPTELGEMSADYCVNEKGITLSLQFLQTCRQISVDAALIPYTTNNFRVHSSVLTRFERGMSAFQEKSIKTLTLLYAARDWRTLLAKKAAQKFSSLETLDIVVYQNRYRTLNMDIMEGFSGLPLRDVFISEMQERVGTVQSFDHKALRTRLLDAGSRKIVLEPIRQARSQERAALAKERLKTLNDAYEAEIRQAVQNGNARAMRAARRQKR